ncbi:unnamed protein product [Effrenium voratum]|nr:unnamed protein product [Effrenium voratum]
MRAGAWARGTLPGGTFCPTRRWTTSTACGRICGPPVGRFLARCRKTTRTRTTWRRSVQGGAHRGSLPQLGLAPAPREGQKHLGPSRRGTPGQRQQHRRVVHGGLLRDPRETSNRFLYDSTVVGLAPSLLFAPSRSWREVHRGKRVVVELEQSWHVAVDVQVADELFKLRQLVANFLDTVVGRVPSQWQLDAAAELQKLFAEKVATAGGDVSDADTEMQSVAEDAW